MGSNALERSSVVVQGSKMNYLMNQGAQVILGGKKNMFSEYFSFPLA